MKRWILYPFEMLFFGLLLGLFRLLGLKRGSALAGRLCRSIGPRLGISNIARRQMRRALPHLSPALVEQYVTEMWENLGRVFAEYAHLSKLMRQMQTGELPVEGAQFLTPFKSGLRQGIFFSGHVGNWEVSLLVGLVHELNLVSVYRAPNNPLADWAIRKLRRDPEDHMLKKGTEGARGLIKALENDRNIALLIDQKMNDGIAIPFFGQPAMTATAIAQFALKYNLPLIPVHVVRESGSHFKVVIEEPFYAVNTGNREKDVYETMMRLHRYLERWIRAHPGQWFWLHKRWPKDS